MHADVADAIAWFFQVVALVAALEHRVPLRADACALPIIGQRQIPFRAHVTAYGGVVG